MITGQSTWGKSGLEENACVGLCSRHSASLSCDLSHPQKGEDEWGQKYPNVCRQEHAVEQGGLTSFDLEPQEETHRGPVDT